MTERPDIVSDSGDIGLRQVHPTLGRHRTGVLFRLWHAVLDGVHDRFHTAITPQIFAGGQIGTNRRTLAVAAVASRTGTTLRLSVENAVTQRELIRRTARRDRQ